ncbi:MAG: hypothetical protein Q8P67_22065 [archaeon]|nr:hypothetical protein [archaeon]
MARARHVGLITIGLLWLTCSVFFLEVTSKTGEQKRPHDHGHTHERHASEPVAGDLLMLKPLDRVLRAVGKGKDEGEYDRWAASGTVGNYLQVQEVEGVALPVYVNLIFLGFDGDGANRVELTSENFEPWFQHLEHEVPHRVVPLGNEQTTVHKFSTAHSLVKYRYALNVVKLAPVVNAIIEDALLWATRADGAESKVPRFRGGKSATQTLFYADAHHVSSILGSLTEYLGISDESYTLFVMNPQPPISDSGEFIYGYRAGLSPSELGELREAAAMLRQHQPRAPPPRAPRMDMASLPLNPKPQGNKPAPAAGIPTDKLFGAVGEIDLVDKSKVWGQRYITDVLSAKARHFGPGTIEGTSSKEAQEEAGEPLSEDASLYIYRTPLDYQGAIVERAKRMLVNGTVHEREYVLHAISDGSLQSDCLVDSWVSHSRFAWMDLSAGPFSWGPSIAAEGVRTFSTLPKTHGATEWTSRKPHEIVDKDYFRVQKETQETLFKAFCDTDATRTYCTALSAKIAKLKQLEQTSKEEHAAPVPNSKSGTKPAKQGKSPRAEEASDAANHLDLAGSPDEGADVDSQLDSFLAQLSASISSALHHLVTPPVPLFPTQYFERVTFHFFMISNHGDHAFASEGRFSFDYKTWKREVLKLRKPSQEFLFVRKNIQMSDDFALGMAYVNSLRSVTLPTIDSEGAFVAHDQAYLDSVQLQMQLKHVSSVHSFATSEASPLPPSRTAASHSLHLPILFFSVHHEEPLLIDKYYQAKALDDMIVVVQSSEQQFQSRLSCNGVPVNWNLRNPLKATLAATAVHLGGLVPPHLGYSVPRQAATQDWAWSIGDHPLSHTSSSTAHAHFNQFQRDISGRNYVAHALNQSVALVNHAVRLLHHQATHDDAPQIVANASSHDLDKLYQGILDLWVRMIDSVSELRIDDAVSLISELQTATNLFTSDALAVVDALNDYSCRFQSHFQLDSDSQALERTLFQRWGLPAFLLIDCILVFLFYFFVQPRHLASSKIKVN